MSKTSDKPVCHRADDLVTWMYGEASTTEAADFAHHVNVCASCQKEIELLTGVRESMSQWRSEVLGSAWRAEPLAVVNSLPSREAQPRRHLSALAALREFFAISPLWLRGATAVAAVLFCLLAALFAVRMLKTPEPLYTRDEVNAEVQQKLDQLRQQSPRPPATPDKGIRQEVARGDEPSSIIPASSTIAPTRHQVAAKESRRFLSRKEREQLAADLRLNPSTDDEDVTFVLDGGSN